ncbi:MAG: DNA-directed RNA polymerase subunit beta', partial [Acidobacteria bacterium]|nr:DNA-directed RNA polymerase subunit beta' [Acidobacteriota bacterium]
FEEVAHAYELGEVETHSPIYVRYTGRYIGLEDQKDDQSVTQAEPIEFDRQLIYTTVGRVMLAMNLPKDIPFLNGTLKKKGLQDVINFCFHNMGLERTVEILDIIKNLGFNFATRSGLSIGVDDMRIPSTKRNLVDEARGQERWVNDLRQQGVITDGERHNKIIDIWHRVTEKVADAMSKEMQTTDGKGGHPFNPIHMMADSGARGSKEQVRQLAGMRGPMSKPSGEVMEQPIISNFREGLSVLEYFISTHGARKGLADTALKTADSGYLTRRLVDVAQDVIITEEDCGTFEGIVVMDIKEGGEILEPLRDRIVGRICVDDIFDPATGEVIVASNDEISEDLSTRVSEAGFERIRIRSVLTCETKRGVCRKCYGRNLATGRLVDIGEAVGVIAAQSIGEPGTQLTMRTFHYGGTARVSEAAQHKAKNLGFVRLLNVSAVRKKKKASDGTESEVEVVVNRNGKLVIQDAKGKEKERYSLAYGSELRVRQDDEVKPGQVLVEWDPFASPILSETAGTVAYKDIVEGENLREDIDRVTGLSQKIVVETTGTTEKRSPMLIIQAEDGTERKYQLPIPSHLLVAEGDLVNAGDFLAKKPVEKKRTRDIVGGLPRVVELFEARRPKESATITEVTGVVRHAGAVKGQQKLVVESEDGQKREYLIPRGVHIMVGDGEHVEAGDALTEGDPSPHDILSVRGEKELQRFLVGKIQEVYRSQGVAINDKHIEVIVRQMMRSMKVEEVGDTDFLVDEQVDRFRFYEENQRILAAGGTPASGRPLLLGITKASLSTDSLISAASFQETTRVLTEASISGKTDYLRGLKENVIVGRLIPAGTGMDWYRNIVLEREEIPVLPEENEELDYEEDTIAHADQEDE